MSIPLIDNFNINTELPIDSRMVASNSTVRDAISYKYDGMKVFLLDDRKTYIWNKNNSSWDEEWKNYKSYTTLLSQSGTSAPTEIKLESNIGSGTWSYSSVGTFRLTVTNGFDGVVPQISGFCGPYTSTSVYYGSKIDNSNYEIRTLSALGSGLTNSVLLNTPIEIKVWQL